jgi:hypothetical protein
VHGFTSRDDCRRRERPTGLAVLIGTESQRIALSHECPHLRIETWAPGFR